MVLFYLSTGWSSRHCRVYLSKIVIDILIFFSVLSRVKVKFVNTKIRIEHVPKNGDRGIALEVHIKKYVTCLFTIN